MAKDIIKAVAQVLSERDGYGLALGMDPDHPFLAMGKYYSMADAVKGATEAREAGLTARVARLSGIGSIKPAEVRNALCECGHSVDLHPKADRCRVVNPSCKCRGFVKVVKE